MCIIVLDGESGELMHMHQESEPERIRLFLEELSDEHRGGGHRPRRDLSEGGSGTHLDGHHLRQVPVIINYNKVIDEVRRHAWRKAKPQDKPVIKVVRYILFKRPECRTADDAPPLGEVMAANESIATIELLKDDLRQLWTYRYRA